MVVLNYSEICTEIETRGRYHLLLGNGFSIACDPLFAYSSLFDYAVAHGLPERVKAVFTHLGTNNFEGVMRLLEHGAWLVGHYGATSGERMRTAMEGDLAAIKSTLVHALTKTHFSRPHMVEEMRVAACRQFLSPFFNIFTLNYDLLLYWVCMSDATLMRRDCFGASEDDPDADYCVFNEHLGRSAGILFLHGALHLYVAEGEVRKHTWSRTGTPLIDLVRGALNEGLYPLFVAEGAAQKKKEQIEASSYLSYCLGKLGRIKGPLVTYGWAMGDSDRHILDTIAHNADLPVLYVGLYGDWQSEANRSIRAAADALTIQRRECLANHHNRGTQLEVKFFDSATAPVWSAGDGGMP